MMGGNQSFQKGNIDDVFKYFKEELDRWTTISKNLKEYWEKNDRSWVPAYLFYQMEETEERWKKIKSIIVPHRKEVNQVEKDSLSVKVPSNYQEIILEKEQSIKRMEENYETLLQKYQRMEKELKDLRQSHVKRDLQSPPISSYLSKPVEKLSIVTDFNSSSNSSISDGKERNPAVEDYSNSAQQNDLKKMTNKESKSEEKKGTLERRTDELSVKIDSLNASVKKFENDDLELKERERLSEDTQRPESGARKTGTQQNEKQQGNIENTHGNDPDANKHSTNEEQKKQRIEFEEKKNLMKLNKELQDKINRLQADKQKLKLTQNQQCGECMARSVPVKHEKQSVKKSYEEKLQTKCLETIELREEIDMLKAQNDSLKTYTNKLTEEKDELLLRLSRFAGDKLVENNPAVTDLSDPNRPTKLAEFYSELYDNEWTNAFEALQSAGYDERTTIETLRLTLENVLQFCEGKAELLLRKASDAVNLLFKEYQQSVLQMKVPSHLTLPRQNVNAMGKYLQRENSSLDEIKLQRMWKPRSEKEDKKFSSGKVQAQDTIRVEAENKLKNLRKDMASTMVPIVQKAYIEASWTDGCIDEMKPYILKCLYLGWMMKVQSPPMVFHKCKIDVGFDRNLYKEYVTSGPSVNYVVWPALLLNVDGPLVCKGVAEGKKNFP